MFVVSIARGIAFIENHCLEGTLLCLASEVVAMPQFKHVCGLCENQPGQMSFAKWQRSMCEDLFSSQTSFLAHVVHAPIVFPPPFKDTPMTRAMGVFAHYGLIKKISSCPIPRCTGKPHIVSKYRSDNGRLRYEWYCSSGGADHMQESVTGIGPLTKIRVGGWMPFLNFVFLLNKNRALHLAHTEVQDAWGTSVTPPSMSGDDYIRMD